MASIALAATAMVDANITDARFLRVTAGAALAAGLFVVQHPTTGRYVAANATDLALKNVSGLLLTPSGADGQTVTIAQPGARGFFTISGLGAVLTAGEVYVLSGATAGNIAPAADLTAATTWYNIVVGVAQSTSSLKVQFLLGDAINS